MADEKNPGVVGTTLSGLVGTIMGSVIQATTQQLLIEKLKEKLPTKAANGIASGVAGSTAALITATMYTLINCDKGGSNVFIKSLISFVAGGGLSSAVDYFVGPAIEAALSPSIGSYSSWVRYAVTNGSSALFTLASQKFLEKENRRNEYEKIQDQLLNLPIKSVRNVELGGVKRQSVPQYQNLDDSEISETSITKREDTPLLGKRRGSTSE